MLLCWCVNEAVEKGNMMQKYLNIMLTGLSDIYHALSISKRDSQVTGQDATNSAIRHVKIVDWSLLEPITIPITQSQDNLTEMQSKIAWQSRSWRFF